MTAIRFTFASISARRRRRRYAGRPERDAANHRLGHHQRRSRPDLRSPQHDSGKVYVRRPPKKIPLKLQPGMRTRWSSSRTQTAHHRSAELALASTSSPPVSGARLALPAFRQDGPRFSLRRLLSLIVDANGRADTAAIAAAGRRFSAGFYESLRPLGRVSIFLRPTQDGRLPSRHRVSTGVRHFPNMTVLRAADRTRKARRPGARHSRRPAVSRPFYQCC